MTRFTFTSVVCAESITEISSSTGLRKSSAILASACSTASRSMIGLIRSRRRPTGRRASWTKLRGNALEVGGHLVRILRLEQPADHLLRVWIRRRPDRGRSRVDRVRRASGARPPPVEQAQNAPCRPSYGMPTLPALTKRIPSTSRSNWTCVCPPTTTRSSTPSSAARKRSSGETLVRISSSSRGEPWQ